MPVDRQSQAVLDYMARMETTPLHELTPAQARKNEMLVLEPGPAMSSVTDVSIPGPGGKLDLRVYDPHGTIPSPRCSGSTEEAGYSATSTWKTERAAE